MDIMTIALILLGLAGVLLLIGVATTRERVATAEMEERLERFGGSGEQIDEEERQTEPNFVAERVGRAVQNRKFGDTVALQLMRADVRMTVGEFLMVRAGTAFGGFLLGFIAGRGFTEPGTGLLFGIVLAILGWMLPHWYLGIRGSRRSTAFNSQLGDTVSLMANSLRAGYSLLQTMEMVAKESPEPMGTEFRRVVREVGLGISAQAAMQNMLKRVPSEDLDLMVTAINIQHEVGGNLAQILDLMGETIRERVRIKGEIKTLTAQGTISTYIITALPIVMAALLFLINPAYMSNLLAWPWICLPIAGAVSIFIGFMIMRKIVNIDV